MLAHFEVCQADRRYLLLDLARHRRLGSVGCTLTVLIGGSECGGCDVEEFIDAGEESLP